MLRTQVTAVSVGLLSSVALLGHAEVVQVTLDDYVIVLDDESPSSFQNASQWCESHLSSSLASFHTLDQLDEVLDEISRNMSDVFSGDRYFWYGERCEWQDWGFDMVGNSYNRRINWFSNKDGTQFDFTVEQSSDVAVTQTWSAFRSTNCSVAYALHFDEESDVFRLNQASYVVNQTQAFICNAHTDAAWQSLNPTRSDFLQCNGTGLGSECILDCTVNQQCMYLNHSLIQGVHSLDVICGNSNSCKGMTVQIEDVSEVAFNVKGQRSFKSGLLIANGVDILTLESSRIEGTESSYLFVFESSALEMKSTSQEGFARSTVVGRDIDGYVSMECGGYAESCTQIKIDLERIGNFSLDVQYGRIEPIWQPELVLSDVGNIDINCFSLSSFYSSCLFLNFDVTNADSFALNCLGEGYTCWFPTLKLSMVNNVEIECGHFFGCYELEWLPQPGSEDTRLNLICLGYYACRFAWFERIPPVVMFETEQISTLTMYCQGYRACQIVFLDDFYYGNGMNFTSVRDSMMIACVGWDDPCGTLVSLTNVFSVISNTSTDEVNLLCVDNGCNQAVLDFNPEVSSATLTCQATGKYINVCSDVLINGYCLKESLEVVIGEDTNVPGMQVICPDGKKNPCKVRVNKGGVMEQGSIAMTDKLWKKTEYKLTGDEQAFEVVSSKRISGDSECDAVNSETRCFIVKDSEKNRWFESNSCEEFVLSLYSPFTTMTLSGTGMIGSIFLSVAINLSGSDWRVNGILFCFFLMCFTTLIGSLELESIESGAKSSLDDDSDFSISTDVFNYWASLNGFCFVLFITACEIWYIHSDREQRPMRLTVAHHGSTSEKQKRLKTTLVLICNLRIMEMMLIYLVRSYSGLSLIALSFIFIALDLVFMAVPKALRVSLVITFAIWLAMSNYSPLWVLIPLNTEPSFFSVVIASSSSGVLLWFDFVLIQLTFGLSVIVMIFDGNELRFKVYMMFVQFLDFVTDWVVVIFWFSGGFIFWAVMELFFLMSAAIVGWISVHKELNDWFEHAIILCGLGRGLSRIKLWDGMNDEWIDIDKSISQMETFYESYPSVFLGFYLVISDDYYSEITGSPGGGTANLGPLIVSVMITALSVTNKTIIKTRSRIIKGQSISLSGQCLLILVVCLFIISDFIVRCVPLCYLFAIAQHNNQNIWAAPAMIGVGLTVIVVGMAEQAAGIRFASVMDDGAWKSEALFSAFPSIMSCSPMFFGCFSDPRLFDYGRFFTVHWLTIVQSTLFLIASLITHAVTQNDTFSFPWYGSLFCLFLGSNLAAGLSLQFHYGWIFDHD